MFRPGGGHFYTSNPAERNSVIARGFVDEGHIGYVYADKFDGLVPLHRWYKPKMDRHFYLTSKEEGDRAGFQYEGVVGHVLPGGSAGAGESACMVSALDKPNTQVAGGAPAVQPSIGRALDLSRPIQIDLSGQFTMPMGNNFTMPMGNNLANASPFTMPMGNNFVMPMGQGLTVQSLDKDLVGVWSVMGARSAEGLVCLEVSRLFGGLGVSSTGSYAQRPQQSIWIWGARDGRIRQFDQTTKSPSDRCVSLGPVAGATPQVAIVTPCAQATRWMATPTIQGALSPLGYPGFALGRLGSQNASLYLLNVQNAGVVRWALLPVPKMKTP